MIHPHCYKYKRVTIRHPLGKHLQITSSPLRTVRNSDKWFIHTDKNMEFKNKHLFGLSEPIAPRFESDNRERKKSKIDPPYCPANGRKGGGVGDGVVCKVLFFFLFLSFCPSLIKNFSPLALYSFVVLSSFILPPWAPPPPARDTPTESQIAEDFRGHLEDNHQRKKIPKMPSWTHATTDATIWFLVQRSVANPITASYGVETPFNSGLRTFFGFNT